MRFQAKRSKYSHFCVIERTNTIPSKFYRVIKTMKFSLGGRPKI